jgi:cytochrome c oxidase subunit 3
MKPAADTAAAPRFDTQFDSLAQQRHAATLGMWVFLATELMFFGPLFFGYAYGRVHLTVGFAAASRHTDIVLGTLNTAVLLSSSVTMAMAVEARRFDARRLAVWLLWITAALGTVFLFIKGTEYVHDWQERLVPALRFSFADGEAGGAEMFFLLYFLTTGLHAIHLTIGIVLVLLFAIALQRRRAGFARPERIALVGLYWHFVDLIWIFLYPILYLINRH